MQRQFGTAKSPERTEGPEGDFVGPQTVFAWDLDSITADSDQGS